MVDDGRQRVVPDRVQSLVREFLGRERGESLALDGEERLFDKGLLDSFRFVELVMFLEAELQAQIDLTKVDMNDLATLSGLGRQIASAAEPQAASA